MKVMIVGLKVIIICIITFFTCNCYSQRKVVVQFSTHNSKVPIAPLTIYRDITTTEFLIMTSKDSIADLEILEPTNITLSSGMTQYCIYLFPGDSIKIIKNEDKYLFEGNRKDEWNLMYSLTDLGYEFVGGGWLFEDSPYESYLEDALSKKQVVLQLLSKKIDSLKISNEFISLLERDIECSFIRSLIKTHSRYNKIDSTISNKIYKFVEQYYPFFQKDTTRNSFVFNYSLMNWSLFMARAKSGFIIPVKTKTYNEDFGFDYAENMDIRFEMAKSFAEPIRSEIMYKLISFRFLTNSWEKDFAYYVSSFNTISSNKKLIEKINILAGKTLIAPRSDIEKAMSLETQVTNTKIRDTDENLSIWSELVKANLGKIMYVDVWASWCGPCIKEIRESSHLNDVLSKYKDSLVIIHLSIDENLDMWRKSISNLSISNRQNYNMSLDSGLADLVIPDKTIPKHFIIDKKGKLLTIEAPSLGSPAFLEIIEKLMNE